MYNKQYYQYATKVPVSVVEMGFFKMSGARFSVGIRMGTHALKPFKSVHMNKKSSEVYPQQFSFKGRFIVIEHDECDVQRVVEDEHE